MYYTNIYECVCVCIYVYISRIITLNEVYLITYIKFYTIHSIQIKFILFVTIVSIQERRFAHEIVQSTSAALCHRRVVIFSADN